MKYRVLRWIFFILAVLSIVLLALMLLGRNNFLANRPVEVEDMLFYLSNAFVYLTVAHMLGRWDDRDIDKKIEAYEARVKEEREKEEKAEK